MRLLRLVHQLTGHRFQPCTLIDLRGDRFRGRCCRCGHVDEDAWQWIGSVYQRSAL